jgi:hypothetical protein
MQAARLRLVPAGSSASSLRGGREGGGGVMTPPERKREVMPERERGKNKLVTQVVMTVLSKRRIYCQKVYCG